MPIYEFFCANCNTLYSFFTATIDTEKRPDCPSCGRSELERRPARFAALTGSIGGNDEEESGDDPFAGLDESQMEAAMTVLERELGGLDDSDPEPRQLARAMRAVGDATGMEMGPRMEDLLSRLEAGADPESLEAEMGDLDSEDGSVDEFFRLKKRAAVRARRPRVDDELYFF